MWTLVFYALFLLGVIASIHWCWVYLFRPSVDKRKAERDFNKFLERTYYAPVNEDVPND